MRFTELSRHAPALVSTVRERVHRFIEGLGYGLSYGMARELGADTPFHQVVNIARRSECIRGLERDDREAKKPRGPGGSTDPYFGGRALHGRDFVGQPVQSALQASCGAPIIHGSQSTHSGQLPQPHQQRGCFKCGDIRHMVRNCPRLRTGVPQWSTQAMGSAPVATTPTQLARDGGQAGRGCLRGGGQARCYDFPGRACRALFSHESGFQHVITLLNGIKREESPPNDFKVC
ncbi:uncharacterized protein [Nicotiana tomentosiformis]|uniref:uncharacterized protein n=1 Tax=Nicotiana tomentosiformis TaxID=4098 RepID=UPI00388C701E